MDNVILLMFMSIVFIGALILIIIATTRRPGARLDHARYEQRFTQITQLLAKNEQSALHMAIINADKLLDTAMVEKGIKGTSMGERLKNAKNSFSNVNAVWAAHRLRNQIAHEDNVSVGSDQARRAVETFRKALRELGALL